MHRTGDTLVPIQATYDAVSQFTAPCTLVEVEGAQHNGFAVHNDPQYRQPQSQNWQAEVIRTIAEWLAAPQLSR